MPKDLPEITLPDIKEAPKIDPAEAKKALEAEIQARMQTCMTEVKAILDKHRCVIVPIYLFEGDRMKSDVKIQALP